MPDSSRLIVVSNRLPVSLARNGDEWEVCRSAGGLATAMDPVLRKSGGIWVGWPGTNEEVPSGVLQSLREQHSFYPVDLPPNVARRFYEGYANQALWPLFHSFTSRLQFDHADWAAYIEANHRFCEAVTSHIRPGDRIWIHDYHLMLLPRLLRQRFPTAQIGFFLHIPFPSSDVFAILPRGDELLTGLLGADLVAFQTHLHLQHFRRSLRRLANIESNLDAVETPGRTVRLQALPIGIAPQEFVEKMVEPDTQDQIDQLRAQYRNRQVIAAIDRLDYTKGLPERLRTYRRLLANHPELAGKLVLLQVAVPSRETIVNYQELRGEVHQLVAEINGRFGTAGWVPVVFIHRGIPRSELVAIYSLADVAWVSPLRDGMNLVAKEYVACQTDGNGVLVLSTFAGAAAEMGEALLINPFDEERTADTVLRALTMPAAEKRERMAALRERVLHNDVFAWGERFLSALSEAAAGRSRLASSIPPLLDPDTVKSAYDAATSRLLLVDYDGTLTSFKDRPTDAAPDDELLAILRDLAADPSNRTVVVSGRSTRDLSQWLGDVPNLELAAEHGARWRLPGSSEWQGASAPAGWKDTVRPILQHFVDRTPGSFIEEKELALVWHYRTAEPEFAEWVATELSSMLDGMLAETDLNAYRGSKVVEVKPTWAQKGAVVQRLLSQHPSIDFILAIGDDRTDEDLFAALPQYAFTVHVGHTASRANHRVAGVPQVRALLRALMTPGTA